MVQAHIFISGMVQGVGFRYFIKSEAKKRRLYGWVRNLPDGRVEAVLQGNTKDVQDVIHVCNKGPFLAEVENVVVDWEEITEKFQSFEQKKLI